MVRYAFASNNLDSTGNHNDLDAGGIYVADRHLRDFQANSFAGATKLTSTAPLAISRDFSAATWFNPSHLPASGQLEPIFSVESFTGLYFNLGVSGDSGVGFLFSANGNMQPFVNSHLIPSDVNTWMHVAAVRSNDNLVLYVNGVAADSATVSTGTVDGLSNNMFVGGSTILPFAGAGGFYYGAMDELRIYDRVLSQAEIDTLAEHFPVAVRPTLAGLPTNSVFTANSFHNQYPTAKLYMLTGQAVPSANALPGVYVWIDGDRPRRVVLQ